jgi:Glycosyl hydrolase family 20, domain 2/Glycosyl hydrolase family 20, catalytic domain
MLKALAGPILPTPRHCCAGSDSLRVTPTLRVFHTVNASDADRRSARLLATTIKRHTGVAVRVATTTRYVHRHVLRVATDDAFDIPPEFTPPAHEGYGLRIDAGGMLLVGTDAAGLYYAVQTVAQILRLRRTSGRVVPGVTIRDWPALRHRAVMMDIARQVERPDYVEQFIRDMAACKKNMFVLYFEDKFRWKQHRALSHPLGYTPAEFARLARVAEENHVEFVPALPCLGHCEGILKHDEIAHLRADGAIYQLSMRHPGTRKLLREQIEAILPLYRGGFFHVNCDESPLLAGPPGSPKRYLTESLRLFGEHLVWLHDLLARDGKRIMVWGDMLLHYRQIARNLPRDIIIVDWDYGPLATRHRDAPEWFREQGFDVMVAPAAGRSAEVYHPPHMQMSDNVPHYIRQGIAAGAIGEMTTLWEMRSTNPIVCWPGVVASAQCAWNPDAIAPSRLARAVATNLHGPEAAAEAVRAWKHVGAERFLERYSAEVAEPPMPGRRTYHLDFHEFMTTDPMLFLTYRKSPWADGVAREAARGIEAAKAATSQARWAADDLDAVQLAGIQQVYHADRRRATNAAGRLVVEAERLRRKGRPKDATRRLAEAADELQRLADVIDALIPASRDLWRQTRHAGDPALENIYLRRLKLDLTSLRRHIRRIDAARKKLPGRAKVNLSGLLGGQPVLLIEAYNPSRDLIDILHSEIAVSNDGRTWRTVSDKGWYTLCRQMYTVPLIVGSRLPKHVRLTIKRTHINPRRFPLAERIVISTARTLTPGEIIDGPPEADLETIDWRLVRTPKISYGLRSHKGWVLHFERQDA